MRLLWRVSPLTKNLSWKVDKFKFLKGNPKKLIKMVLPSEKKLPWMGIGKFARRNNSAPFWQGHKHSPNSWNSPDFRSRSNSGVSNTSSSDDSTHCRRVTPQRIIFDRKECQSTATPCQNRWRCTCKTKEEPRFKDAVAKIDQKDNICITLELHNYQPHELSVKVVDNFLVIEGKSGDGETENGCVSRNFERKYQIPEDYDTERVISAMSKEGVLTITVPAKEMYEYIEVPVGNKTTAPRNVLQKRSLPWKYIFE